MFNEFNPFIKEKKVEEVIVGNCAKCTWFKAKDLCTKYNMITEPCKSCKSYKERK